MAPIRSGGPRAAFPRPGAWTKLSDGRVGIIFKINTINVEDPAAPPKAKGDKTPVEMIPIKEAEVHIVDGKRETAETIKLPADQLTLAAYDDIRAHIPSDQSMFNVAAMGYALSDADLKSLTALQRLRLGKSLNDSDKAQALIEQSEEELDALKRARIGRHPDAIALEEQIEKERAAFVASVEKRRQDMFDKLSKEGK